MSLLNDIQIFDTEPGPYTKTFTPLQPEELRFSHTQTPRDAANGQRKGARMEHTYALQEINYDTGTAVLRIVGSDVLTGMIATMTRPNVVTIVTKVKGQMMEVTFSQNGAAKRSAPEIPMTVVMRPSSLAANDPARADDAPAPTALPGAA
jgi:hypothetical protein